MNYAGKKEISRLFIIDSLFIVNNITLYYRNLPYIEELFKSFKIFFTVLIRYYTPVFFIVVPSTVQPVPFCI